MALKVIQSPGGGPMVVRCPYCSMHYEETRYPNNCERCGCPMEMNKARQFREDQAVRTGVKAQERPAQDKMLSGAAPARNKGIEATENTGEHHG